MNIENINKAIAVVKRIKNLSMKYWQNIVMGDLCSTEEELHSCGTPACFAGHIAVSPEFQEDGGVVDTSGGYPIFNGWSGALAIEEWLEISDGQALSLCWIEYNWRAYPEAYEEERQPTVEEIVYALETLRDTGKLPAEEVE